MTDQQIKNVATGFLSVIRTQPQIYDEWKSLPKVDKYAEFGDFIQRTMHLATIPTNVEIDKMKALIMGELAPEVKT